MRFITIICILLQVPVFAQHGTIFRELTFEQALTAAQEEGKLVFMDCYTSWCGPCRKMAENIFPLQEAGDFFNPRFVCVKYDMEKGEGPQLAKQFNIQGYPTFLIIRPDRSLQHKIVGAYELPEFISQVEKGLNDTTNLSYLNQLYREGKMNKSQLVVYHKQLLDVVEIQEAQQVYNDLVNQLSDEEKLQPEYWPTIYQSANCPLYSPMYKFLLTHLTELRENIGKKEVDSFLEERYFPSLQDYIMGYNNERTSPMHLLQEQIPLLNIEHQETLNNYLQVAELTYYKKIQELATLIEQNLNHQEIEDLLIYAYAYRAIAWNSEKDSLPAEWHTYGKHLADLMISKMEQEKDSLNTPKIVSDYVSMIYCFQHELPQDLRERLIKLGQTILPNLQGNEVQIKLVTDLFRL